MNTQETGLARALSQAPVASGLEGIVVAETRLSHVDGEQGRLIIAGHDVEALSGHLSFEDAIALLFAEAGLALPAAVGHALGIARLSAFERLGTLGNALSQPHAMDGLRAAMGQLSEASTPFEVIGAAPVFAAAWARARSGQPFIAPSLSRSHAQDFLAMLGLPHGPGHARALDAYLVTVCDHGLNASTFTARVIASTGSDLVSAVVGAIGALKGPLHGGAPGPVLDLLDAVDGSAEVGPYLRAQLDKGQRIMGMGHRIYRVRDPRALVLERAVEALESALDASFAVRERLTLARAVEREAERELSVRYPGRALRANVEFYTAVLLEALGIPRALFSAVFAAGRVLGWTAHYEEQRKTGRLIRPSSRYVGR